MEIKFSKKQIENIVKQYYIDNYDFKLCSVKTKIETVKEDILKSDLGKDRNRYYSISHNMVVSGYVKDPNTKDVNYYKVKDIIDEKKIKYILETVFLKRNLSIDKVGFNYLSRDPYIISRYNVGLIGATIYTSSEKSKTYCKN